MPRISHFWTLYQFDTDILAELPEETLLIGLDEVGRGSLIDCIMAGAACLPVEMTKEQEKCLTYLNDSKKLTPSLRAELSEAIHSFCLTGIGIASLEEVEALNVYHASVLALERAAKQLLEKTGIELNPFKNEGITPTLALPPQGGGDFNPSLLKGNSINLKDKDETPGWFLILDGKALLPGFHRERQKAIVKGDGRSAAIAAASVIAKHARDMHVKHLAEQYPGYGWEKNMGYGTLAHQNAIELLGLTPLHRRQFKTCLKIKNNSIENQS